ncbi:MAG: hypothetical protein HGN29_14975 [Asgard group archaeon]|nr:hypothetical protein [Asgard group archaeon]
MVIKSERPIQKGEIEALLMQIDKFRKNHITFIKNQTTNFLENIKTDEHSIKKLIEIFYEDYLKISFIELINDKPISISIRRAIKKLDEQSELLRNYIKDQYLDTSNKKTRKLLYILSFNVYNLKEGIKELIRISDIFNKILKKMQKLFLEKKESLAGEIQTWFFNFSRDVSESKLINHRILEIQYKILKENHNI